jgi:hypothetical protein
MVIRLPHLHLLPRPKPSETALEYSRALQRFAAAVSARAAAADGDIDAAFPPPPTLGSRSRRSRLAAEVAKSDKKLSAQVTARTKETSDSALALLDEADERRHLVGEYRRHLDQLGQSTKSALDGSFKIFGRFIAREYLLQLDANLQGIRERMEDTIASNATAASLAALAASEHEFSNTLEANRGSLQRVQGLEWVSSTDNQLSVLAAFRESLQRAQSAYGETAGQAHATIGRCGRDRGRVRRCRARDRRQSPPPNRQQSSRLPAEVTASAPAAPVVPPLLPRRLTTGARDHHRRGE